jgi:hypothetical protein
MATAENKLARALPGPGWTLPKLTELAKELIDELGDLTGYEFYKLMQLPVDGEVSIALPEVLVGIRNAYWSKQGKTPPDLDEEFM